MRAAAFACRVSTYGARERAARSLLVQLGVFVFQSKIRQRDPSFQRARARVYVGFSSRFSIRHTKSRYSSPTHSPKSTEFSIKIRRRRGVDTMRATSTASSRCWRCIHAMQACTKASVTTTSPHPPASLGCTGSPPRSSRYASSSPSSSDLLTPNSRFPQTSQLLGTYFQIPRIWERYDTFKRTRAQVDVGCPAHATIRTLESLESYVSDTLSFYKKKEGMTYISPTSRAGAVVGRAVGRNGRGARGHDRRGPRGRPACEVAFLFTSLSLENGSVKGASRLRALFSFPRSTFRPKQLLWWVRRVVVLLVLLFVEQSGAHPPATRTIWNSVAF